MRPALRYLATAVMLLTTLGTLSCSSDAASTSSSSNELSSSPGDLSTEPPTQIIATSGPSYYFESTSDMAATSDLVVVGTVSQVAQGRQLGDPADNEEDPMYVRDATVSVEEVLKGSPTESVVVEQQGIFPSTGVTVALEDSPWLQVGDRGVFFLYDSSDPGQPPDHYYLINSVGLILLDGSQVISFSETPLAASYLDMAPAELLESVAAEVDLAVTEGLPPQEPFSETDSQVELDLPDQPRDEGALDQPSEEEGPTDE